MAAVRFPLLLLFLLFLLLFSLFKPSSSLSDTEALLKFKQSLKVPAGVLDSWAPGSSPCKDRWVGIYCTQSTIFGIHLNDSGISGTIDVQALAALPDLKTVRLDNNSFAGPIPPFNQLVGLRGLFLAANQLSGEIPNDYFASMTNLRRFNIANNQMTGKIPDSLVQLPYLKELHLEGNHFSGPIPPLRQGLTLTDLNMSNNNLEGEIPSTYANFDSKPFQGNHQLCGKQLNGHCNQAPQSSAPSGSHFKATVFVTGMVVLVIFLLMVAMIAARRRRDAEFSVLEKEHLSDNEAGESHVPDSIRRPVESTRKGSGESNRRGTHNPKNGMGDLVMVNEEKGVFGLPDLMKAAAEVLGNGSLGSAYKALMNNGMCVVVKRMREMNKLGRDGFDAEMRRFGRLSHPNILTPLAYHYRREEKLLVSNYMPKSSLLYVLHGDRGIFHAELNWATRLRIIQGVAHGMDFLHREFASYDLPHGNLKSSNVLLTENYDPVLSDYAFLPLVHPNNAPQALFAFKSPEYIQHQRVSPKSDVYCLGIVILEILTGKFPSQYLSNGKGGTDVVQWVQTSVAEQKEEELIDPEISNNADSIGEMIRLLQIGAACVESNPQERLDMREAISRIEELQP